MEREANAYSTITSDGRYRIYHASDVKAPAVLEDINAWYFEPHGWFGGQYSTPHASAEDSERAAHEYAAMVTAPV